MTAKQICNFKPIIIMLFHLHRFPQQLRHTGTTLAMLVMVERPSPAYHLESTQNSALLNKLLRFPFLPNNKQSLLHNSWSPSRNLPLPFKFTAISSGDTARTSLSSDWGRLEVTGGGWGGGGVRWEHLVSIGSRGRLRISYRERGWDDFTPTDAASHIHNIARGGLKCDYVL